MSKRVLRTKTCNRKPKTEMDAALFKKNLKALEKARKWSTIAFVLCINFHDDHMHVKLN